MENNEPMFTRTRVLLAMLVSAALIGLIVLIVKLFWKPEVDVPTVSDNSITATDIAANYKYTGEYENIRDEFEHEDYFLIWDFATILYDDVVDYVEDTITDDGTVTATGDAITEIVVSSDKETTNTLFDYTEDVLDADTVLDTIDVDGVAENYDPNMNAEPGDVHVDDNDNINIDLQYTDGKIVVKPNGDTTVVNKYGSQYPIVYWVFGVPNNSLEIYKQLAGKGYTYLVSDWEQGEPVAYFTIEYKFT